MSIQLKETFDKNNKLIEVQFVPNSEQLRFALHRANFKNESKSDGELLKELGIPKTSLKRWEDEYGNHYREWHAWYMENVRAPVKEALFAFGVDRALRGEFSFWREVSRTTGAITPEVVEIKNTQVKGIDELAALTDDELAREEALLIASLTGRALVKDSVPESLELGGQESDSPGIGEVQEEPALLHF